MKLKAIWEKICTIITAWPPLAASFVVASFACTVWRFWNAYSGRDTIGWLEARRVDFGADRRFLLTALVILGRKESIRQEAATYGLTRGLATGYYFNYVRPLLAAIRDPRHEIHKLVAEHGRFHIGGLLVGIPSSLVEFDPEQHEGLIQSALQGLRVEMTVNELKVPIKGRPRPIVTKLVTVPKSQTAILLDIPTTLSVVKDFSEFIATHEGGAAAADDEFIIEASKKMIAKSEVADFERRLTEMIVEFQTVVGKVGAMESLETSASALVHIVSTRKLKHRLSELVD